MYRFIHYRTNNYVDVPKSVIDSYPHFRQIVGYKNSNCFKIKSYDLESFNVAFEMILTGTTSENPKARKLYHTLVGELINIEVGVWKFILDSIPESKVAPLMTLDFLSLDLIENRIDDELKQYGLLELCRQAKVLSVDAYSKTGDELTFNWDNALQEASFSGNRSLINFLIAKGADDWNKGIKGAIKGRQLPIAKLMALKTKNLIDRENFRVAGKMGDIAYVERVLNTMREIGLNMESTWVDEIIEASCEIGSIEMTLYFLKYSYARIPVNWAQLSFSSGNEDYIRWITDRYAHYEKHDAFFGACKGGYLKLAKSLFDSNVKEYYLVTSGGLNMKRLFYYVCKAKHEELLTWLVKVLDNTFHPSGFEGACASGDLSFTQRILEEHPQNDLKEALKEACEHDHTEIILWLLELETPITRDAIGGAVRSGNYFLVKYLIAKSSLNSKSTYDYAIETARLLRSKNMKKLLLKDAKQAGFNYTML